jgi:23S rRNA pseudouridine2605 synthase
LSIEQYPLRLQKYLARAGVASRRGSENLMTQGRVRVNGVVAVELGTKVRPGADEVTVDGVAVSLMADAVYLMLNKPAGYLTTMDDPHGRPTVKELVCSGRHPGLFPVGRLDLDTTGILLFMTDGELAHRLLHPRHHVEKAYRVRVDGVVGESDAERLAHGVMLNDGITLPARVELLSSAQSYAPWADGARNGPLEGNYPQCRKPNNHQRRAFIEGRLPVKESELRITVVEGRKRQIKRMCAAVGHPVLALHRESFGPLSLGGLEEGRWRYLTPEEVQMLRACDMA